jgi:uncharacterized protein with PIN domain
MNRPKRPPSPRTERRAAERDLEKLAQDRERLALLEAGGTPEHPCEVTSASQVSVRATRARCPRCEGELRLVEHAAARRADGAPLRLARLVCASCGAKRTMYFRVGSAAPN